MHIMDFFYLFIIYIHMSLSYQHLNAVEVRDPRTIIQTQRDYAVLKSGSQFNCRAWTSTSISNSSIQFSCPPPSGANFVDSKIYMYLPVRLTFTGIPPEGQSIIRAGYDAPRAYPISGSIDTASATINGQSMNINIGDIIHAISHYNTDEDLKNGDYSTFPTYSDQTQQYNDMLGANRNPLGSYSDGIDGSQMQRGAFPYVIVSNPVQAVGQTLTLTAVIDVSFTEPLFLPPFYFGTSNRQAFYNVNAMDFNFTFIGQMANRMWSHNATNGTTILTAQATIGGTIGGPQSSLPGGQLPLMLINYITPQETQVISPTQPLTYPYFDIQRYPTQQGSVAAGASSIMNSSNLQLSSIPRRMYIFVRDSNYNLYSSPSYTDTFFQINNLSVQFMNTPGLLSGANFQQLYQISRKNHCNMNWTQWSGGPSIATGTGGSENAPIAVSTIGSVIALEFGTDIGLASLDAPGKLGQFMVSVTITAKNISDRAIVPTLYLVPILEGTFTIPELGRAMINIGVLSSQDILDAQSKPGYSYDDVERVSGGDFFSGIKSFFTNKVLPQLKEFVNNRGVSKTLATIPHPYAQIASKAAHVLGYGEDEGGVLLPVQGGVRAGGGKMNRINLQNRMKNF